MAIGTRSYTRGYLSSSGLPPGIRALLISNIAVFVITFFVLAIAKFMLIRLAKQAGT